MLNKRCIAYFDRFVDITYDADFGYLEVYLLDIFIQSRKDQEDGGVEVAGKALTIEA